MICTSICNCSKTAFLSEPGDRLAEFATPGRFSLARDRESPFREGLLRSRRRSFSTETPFRPSIIDFVRRYAARLRPLRSDYEVRGRSESFVTFTEAHLLAEKHAVPFLSSLYPLLSLPPTLCSPKLLLLNSVDRATASRSHGSTSLRYNGYGMKRDPILAKFHGVRYTIELNSSFTEFFRQFWPFKKIGYYSFLEILSRIKRKCNYFCFECSELIF